MRSFFSKTGRFLLTGDIYDNSCTRRKFYKYFLIGMLVRLAFLPFFFQRDLLSTYQRAAETVFLGNFGSDFQQMLTNIIHSVYLFILKVIFPAVGEYSEILLNTDSWASWVGFIGEYNVFTMLFLFKFLYLIFDLICMFLIIRLLFDGEPENKLKAFIFWIFNPIVIFVTYIFARHDIIGVAVTLFALLLAKNRKKYWAILVLAAAVALRFFPVMILPLLIFYLAEKKKDYVILSAIGISGLAIIEVFSYSYFGKSVIFSLLNAQHFDYILSANLDLIIHDRIFLFVAGYVLVIFSFIHNKKKTFELFLNYCGIVYLLYVSMCYFHPQYLLWSIPFLVLLFVRRKSLFYYNWIQFALLLIILIYWGDLVTKFVVAPLAPKYFIYLTGPIPLINRFYDPAKFVNIFRSIFTGVSAWMIYLIYRQNRTINNELEKRDIKKSL